MSSFPGTLPMARTPPSAAAPALRWGVLGTGWIAERFVGSLQRHTRQELLPRAYGSYEELVADPEVDVVHVATPHPAHHPLRDRPARRRPRAVLREALWTFFLPRFDVVRQLLDDGALGEVRTVQADHGEYFAAGHRILRHDLAGGPPAGPRHLTTATIAGTLTLPGPFYQPGDVLLTAADGSRQLTSTEPRAAHDALHFEATEVARCVTAGRLETPIRPLAEAVTTIQAMDEIRRQLGIAFPGEQVPAATRS